jgi:hypothetical protein
MPAVAEVVDVEVELDSRLTAYQRPGVTRRESGEAFAVGGSDRSAFLC